LKFGKAEFAELPPEWADSLLWNRLASGADNHPQIAPGKLASELSEHLFEPGRDGRITGKRFPSSRTPSNTSNVFLPAGESMFLGSSNLIKLEW